MARIGVAFQTLEIRTHFGRCLIAQCAVLLQCFSDQACKLRRNTIQPRGLTVQDGVEDHGSGGAGERLRAGRHLIQRDAEGKQIRARVHRLAASLLRGHVSHGAERDAWTGEMVLAALLGRQFGKSHGLLRPYLRETEVENLRLAPARNKDIGGLDVAMNNALLVRGIERVGDFRRETQPLLGR